MKLRQFAASMAGACLILGGCQGGGSKTSEYVPKPPDEIKTTAYEAGKEDQLFPFAVGNQWAYDAELSIIPANGQRPPAVNKQIRFRCTQVVKTNSGTRVNMEVVMDQKVNEVQEWFLNSQGLFQASVGYPPKPFNPPQPAWRAPLKEGGKFSWKGTGFQPSGKIGPMETQSEILAPQEVDTALGKVTAIPVKTRTVWQGGQAVNTTWFANGVGIVRYRQEAADKDGVAIQVMRLKGYSLKK